MLPYTRLFIVVVALLSAGMMVFLALSPPTRPTGPSWALQDGLIRGVKNAPSPTGQPWGPLVASRAKDAAWTAAVDPPGAVTPPDVSGRVTCALDLPAGKLTLVWKARARASDEYPVGTATLESATLGDAPLSPPDKAVDLLAAVSTEGKPAAAGNSNAAPPAEGKPSP